MVWEGLDLRAGLAVITAHPLSTTPRCPQSWSGSLTYGSWVGLHLPASLWSDLVAAPSVLLVTTTPGRLPTSAGTSLSTHKALSMPRMAPKHFTDTEILIFLGSQEPGCFVFFFRFMLSLAAGTRGSPRIPVADTFTLQFSAGPGTVVTAVTGARAVGCWEVTSG